MRNSSRREERRLVAARAGADFEDDVLLVVRILRDQQDLDLGHRARRARAFRRAAVPPARARASRHRRSPASSSACVISASTALYSRNFSTSGSISATRLRVRAVLGLVRLHGGVAEQREQFVVFRFDGESACRASLILSVARSQKPEARSRTERQMSRRRTVAAVSVLCNRTGFCLLLLLSAVLPSRYRRQKRHLVAFGDPRRRTSRKSAFTAADTAVRYGAAAGNFAGQRLPDVLDRRSRRDVARQLRRADQVAQPAQTAGWSSACALVGGLACRRVGRIGRRALDPRLATLEDLPLPDRARSASRVRSRSGTPERLGPVRRRRRDHDARVADRDTADPVPDGDRHPGPGLADLGGDDAEGLEREGLVGLVVRARGPGGRGSPRARCR